MIHCLPLERSSVIVLMRVRVPQSISANASMESLLETESNISQFDSPMGIRTGAKTAETAASEKRRKWWRVSGVPLIMDAVQSW